MAGKKAKSKKVKVKNRIGEILLTLAFCLFTFALPPAAALADSLHVLPRSVSAIFYFSNLSIGPRAMEWTTVDVTRLDIPADAKSVALQGVLRGLAGAAWEWCFMYLLITPTQVYDFQNLIALKSPDDPAVILPAFGFGEIIVQPWGSVAIPFATQVPLIDGKFHYIWTRGTQGEYPERCSYGANLVIQSYTRSEP